MNKKKAYSTSNLLLLATQTLKYQTKAQTITRMIRSKVSTYTNFTMKDKSVTIALTKKLKSKRQKANLYTKQIPQFDTMEDLFRIYNVLEFAYRQRVENNFEEGLYVCMKLLKLAITHQCQVSQFKLDKTRSVIVQAFLFVSQTLIEMGYDKLSFYFGAIGIELGQIYRNCLGVGQGLIIISKILRKSSKYMEAIIILKKALQYLWMNRNSTSEDLQIQAYNELSYNFLQSNMGEESKIFAQKYQTGFLQSQDSKILSLSRQLITSLHKRISTWHKVIPETFVLVFKFDIDSIMLENDLRSPITDQNKVLKKLGVQYDLFSESFMKHQMFFYEIPLPLQLKKQESIIFARKISVSTSKFIAKNRSASTSTLKVYKQNQKIKETIIFNYRGIGIATRKLTSMLKNIVKLFRNSFQKRQNTIQSDHSHES